MDAPKSMPKNEREWQRWVVKFARSEGWKVRIISWNRFDQSDAGWPDLNMWRTKDGSHQVLFIELKTARGIIKKEQRECVETIGYYVPAYIIRLPKDLELLKTLIVHGGNIYDNINAD